MRLESNNNHIWLTHTHNGSANAEMKVEQNSAQVTIIANSEISSALCLIYYTLLAKHSAAHWQLTAKSPLLLPIKYGFAAPSWFNQRNMFCFSQQSQR